MTNEHQTTGTASSRAPLIRPAARKQAKARLAISGATGSGKTWTALSVAEVLAPNGPILVIDTEPSDPSQSAAELYADHFNFDVLPWGYLDYDPRDLAATLLSVGPRYADGVIIVDSASHFWRGQGGTLDIADGRFGGWKVATPAQQAMVEAILRSPAHVIVCTRAKMDYLVEDGGPGTKQRVQKVGLAPIQRDDLEYEFQVAIMLTAEHQIDVSKTRAQVLAGKSWKADQQGAFAEALRDWLRSGLQVIRQADLDLIRAAANTPEVRAVFKAELGAPSNLPPDKLVDAWLCLVEARGIPFHIFVDDTTGVCETCQLGPGAGWHLGGPRTAEALGIKARPEAPVPAAEEPVEEPGEPEPVPTIGDLMRETGLTQEELDAPFEEARP